MPELEAKLRIVLELAPYDVGRLLAQLTTMRETTEDSFDVADSADDIAFATQQKEFEARVRGQIEASIGPGVAEELEEVVQGDYGQLLDTFDWASWLDKTRKNARRGIGAP